MWHCNIIKYVIGYIIKLTLTGRIWDLGSSLVAAY
jgi:hypothetical protein